MYLVARLVIHYKLSIISCLFYLIKLWYFQNYLLTSIFYSTWLSSSLLPILWKKSLKSDFQQFSPKFFLSEQLPLTANNWTQKRSQHMRIEIQMMTWNRHKNMAELNWLMGFQLFLIFTDSLPIKNSIHYHKNKIQHKHITTAGPCEWLAVN
jgi:hypothetical protein